MSSNEPGRSIFAGGSAFAVGRSSTVRTGEAGAWAAVGAAVAAAAGRPIACWKKARWAARRAASAPALVAGWAGGMPGRIGVKAHSNYG
jgi:hypothetical protein